MGPVSSPLHVRLDCSARAPWWPARACSVASDERLPHRAHHLLEFLHRLLGPIGPHHRQPGPHRLFQLLRRLEALGGLAVQQAHYQRLQGRRQPGRHPLHVRGGEAGRAPEGLRERLVFVHALRRAHLTLHAPAARPSWVKRMTGPEGLPAVAMGRLLSRGPAWPRGVERSLRATEGRCERLHRWDPSRSDEPVAHARSVQVLYSSRPTAPLLEGLAAVPSA
jgi:hypothetical protein